MNENGVIGNYGFPNRAPLGELADKPTLRAVSICGLGSATLLALFAVMPLAFAQNAAPIASATAPAKSLAFDVVSIRPSKPGPYSKIDTAITPDGYRVTGQSLFYTI